MKMRAGKRFISERMERRGGNKCTQLVICFFKVVNSKIVLSNYNYFSLVKAL
jgi:hypothetical protein